MIVDRIPQPISPIQKRGSLFLEGFPVWNFFRDVEKLPTDQALQKDVFIATGSWRLKTDGTTA
jgi:hypothetical protein